MIYLTQGERVKYLRDNLGMTLERFGNPLGVRKTTISRIEKGERNLTNQMLAAICKQYSVNEKWLLTGEGDIYKKPSDEIGYYVEELLEYEGSGNPFYDIIIEMMKEYQELDENSKTVIKNYFKKIGEGLHKKED